MSPKHIWRKAVGPKGAVVSAVERTPGRFYLRWWEPGTPKGRWRLEAIAAATRADAEGKAMARSHALLACVREEVTGRITVGSLLDRYLVDVSADKKGQQPKEDERRVALWLTFLSPTLEGRKLTPVHVERFAKARRQGKIHPKVWRLVKGVRTLVPMKLKAEPSETTIGADIIFLQSVVNWAVRARLLDKSPLVGYTDRPKTKKPRRPVVTFDRFEVLRTHCDAVHPRFGAFMDCIEGLGWRVSAICKLRANQVDFAVTPSNPYGRLYKDPSADKEGEGGWIPMPESVCRALKSIPVVGDAPYFPALSTKPNEPAKPWSRWYARDLLEKAETAAALAPVEGGDFHPYRRKWATERKHLPTPDVMKAGGWRDERSLKESYQQTDPETMKLVALEPTKLRAARGE